MFLRYGVYGLTGVPYFVAVIGFVLLFWVPFLYRPDLLDILDNKKNDIKKRAGGEPALIGLSPFREFGKKRGSICTFNSDGIASVSGCQGLIVVIVLLFQIWNWFPCRLPADSCWLAGRFFPGCRQIPGCWPADCCQDIPETKYIVLSNAASALQVVSIVGVLKYQPDRDR